MTRIPARIPAAAAAFALALLLGPPPAATQDHDPDPEAAAMPTQSHDALRGTAWRVTRIGEKAVSPEVESTLVFLENGRVSGNAGCNRFHGGLLPDGEQKFGMLAATRRMCPEPRMQQETRYLRALSLVLAVERDGDTLRLLGGNGGALVVLESMPFPEPG